MTDTTNSLSELRKLAGELGLDTDGNAETLKAAINQTLGDFGYIHETQAHGNSEATRKAYAENTLEAIMAGEIEVAGTDFTTKYPKGRIPKLMPKQIPWGGRRRRLRRIRQKEDDLVGLVLQWGGSRFLFPLEADYADVPWPHYLIMKNAITSKLKQKRVQGEDGRIDYINNWKDVRSFPFEDMGTTPGTEHLPTGMKDYIMEMYVEGFPDFTNSMWRQLCLAYEFSDKMLGIKASVPLKEQIAARRMAVLDRLNLVDVGDAKTKREERIDVVKGVLGVDEWDEAA